MSRRARPRRAWLLLLLGAATALGACEASRPHPDARRATVTVGSTAIAAEVARTPAEKQLGLGGRAGLARDAGMLFVFDTPARHVFWMLDMQFALDFVWIRGDRVVDMTAEVPAPPAGVDAASGLLRELQPKEPADLVLEVAAGSIAKHGWKVGDLVAIGPAPR